MLSVLPVLSVLYFYAVDMLRQLRPLLQMTLESNHYIMRHIVATPIAPPTLNMDMDMMAPAKDMSPATGSLDQRMAKGMNSNFNLSVNIGGCGSGTKMSGGSGYMHSERKEHGGSSLSVPRLDMSSSTNMASSNAHSHSHNYHQGGVESTSSDTSLRLNLGTSMDVDPYSPTTSSQAFFNSGAVPSINTHSWEWKLLDSLVLSRVEMLVHKSDLVSVWDSSQRKSSRNDTGPSSNTTTTSSSSNHDGDTEMEQDEDDVVIPMEPHHSRRLGDRRALIAECKQLRHEIQQFEERWISDYKRSPKPHERGTMQPSYARYKDIKKTIRENAAMDIQRVLRGHVSRQHPPPPSSPSSGPMELEQQQQQQQEEYIQQSQFSHLQKRPASADGYHSPHNSSPLSKALAGAGSAGGGGVSVSMSTSLPLTRSVSDEGPGIPGGSSGIKEDGSHVGMMLQADSKTSPSLSHSSGMKLPQQNAWLSNDNDNPSEHHAMSKSQGGSFSGNKQSGNSGSSRDDSYSDEVNALCMRYQEALDSKKQLKKMLKKFDDDFVLKKGRAPKKVDKEIMRPQYQKYHEVRGDLEKLKTEITKTLGHFPKELEESKATSAAGGGDDTGSVGGDQSRNMLEYSGVHRQDVGGGGGETDHMEDMDDDDDHISGTSISSHGGHAVQQGHGLEGQEHSLGQGSSGSSSEGAKGTGGISNTLGGLDELNHEKKHLHLYLKAFEK